MKAGITVVAKSDSASTSPCRSHDTPLNIRELHLSISGATIRKVSVFATKVTMSLTAVPLPTFPAINGQNTDVLPVMSECTVAQAATLLDMSEHRLNNLLDAGRIAFRQENGERLVERNSLLDYEQRRIHRSAALDEMVRVNQEMGLYDD